MSHPTLLPPSPRKPRWSIPVSLAVATGIGLLIDMAVAAAIHGRQLPSAIEKPLADALQVCEAFGHGFGATLIVITVAVLDPARIRCLPWLFAGSLGSGMVANGLKYLLPRIRPRDFHLDSGTVWDTFAKGQDGWGMQSFPSAHTATAVGLAVMLSTLYPRGRWYFATLAALVGLQRVAVSAHFPSDVFAGATVGWVVGVICAASMLSVGRRDPGNGIDRPTSA